MKKETQARAENSGARGELQRQTGAFSGDAPATWRQRRVTFPMQPQEWKVVSLRECAVHSQLADTPDAVARYWRRHVEGHAQFNPMCECLVAVMLDTRRRVIGHTLVSIGLLDSLLSHPREIFRAAIVACASAIVLVHNHPSGDPTPSEADIKVTRDLIRAGRLVKIELLDHLIMGHRRNYVSLMALDVFGGTPAVRAIHTSNATNSDCGAASAESKEGSDHGRGDVGHAGPLCKAAALKAA